ncbi:MAG: beta-lactamase family protein [Gemmatimonadetes bacterium]|nr:beta-lactamase family protein [Gemmatimonadota bacterium]MYB97285.1 beta-lactamase family protein [Gemmatimonadota bacterium]MYI45812.1 beta-lactamase family protein [Gemmatimonadota bacterium]
MHRFASSAAGSLHRPSAPVFRSTRWFRSGSTVKRRRAASRRLPGIGVTRSLRLSIIPPTTALLLAATALAPLATPAQELPRVDPADAGFAPERLERLGAILEDYVADGSLPGAVVMVLRDGAVVYDKAVGYSDAEAGTPLASDAIFRIASQTKAVVSVAVMMLQEDGMLLIGDPLSRHLPAFDSITVAVPRDDGGYDVVPANRAVTIRDLLTHTAGISYGYGPGGDRWREAGITGWYFAHRDEPVRATVDRMAALPFQAHPGERFVYGYATDILGALVEEVSGQTLDEFLRSRLFDPLDMRDTHFFLPPAKADRLAAVHGHNREGDLMRSPEGPGMNTQGEYVTGPRKSFSGGAGLLSTARDYARFLQMMLNGGGLGDARILSPATVALMTSNHVGDLMGGASGFGLGFQVRLDLGAAGQPGSVGDYGWGGAYHTTFWVDPAERMVVVYFTQRRSFRPVDDHAKLRAVLYGALTG